MYAELQLQCGAKTQSPQWHVKIYWTVIFRLSSWALLWGSIHAEGMSRRAWSSSSGGILETDCCGIVSALRDGASCNFCSVFSRFISLPCDCSGIVSLLLLWNCNVCCGFVFVLRDGASGNFWSVLSKFISWLRDCSGIVASLLLQNCNTCCGIVSVLSDGTSCNFWSFISRRFAFRVSSFRVNNIFFPSL